MFGYSMIQMVRAHAQTIDKSLRNHVLNLYKPMKWTPCFLHSWLERRLMKTRNLSVIVRFKDDGYKDGCEEIKALLKDRRRCKAGDEFEAVSCMAADMPPIVLEEMLSTCDKIQKVYLNREVQALLDTAVPSANAKRVTRSRRLLTGKGKTIAIIDTGVYPHQDLSGRIVAFADFVNGRTDPYDDNGHGTHCAGDAAGNGAASNGRYSGPAHEANIIGVKVLDRAGGGSLVSVMQGLQWCIQYNESRPQSRIDIISMSLGSPAMRYNEENDDPLVQLVEYAWSQGIVVCAAAGNEGPDRGTISSPGISDRVITVGALDDRDTAVTRADDAVAPFSSRGPTIYGKVKPDILAPGVNIISLRSPGSYLDKWQRSSRVGTEYFVMSGTSMATPICAGIVAQMLQQAPDLTPDDVKRLIMEGADLWTDYDPNVYGAGYINADRSIPE